MPEPVPPMAAKPQPAKPAAPRRFPAQRSAVAAAAHDHAHAEPRSANRSQRYVVVSAATGAVTRQIYEASRAGVGADEVAIAVAEFVLPDAVWCPDPAAASPQLVARPAIEGLPMGAIETEADYSITLAAPAGARAVVGDAVFEERGGQLRIVFPGPGRHQLKAEAPGRKSHSARVEVASVREVAAALIAEVNVARAAKVIAEEVETSQGWLRIDNDSIIDMTAAVVVAGGAGEVEWIMGDNKKKRFTAPEFAALLGEAVQARQRHRLDARELKDRILAADTPEKARQAKKRDARVEGATLPRGARNTE
jgi:hypothetical protein